MLLKSQYLESLDCNGIKEIISGIDASRLTAYTEAARSDVEALILYELNARLSGLLIETVGGFEIVLRNVIATSSQRQSSIISSGQTGIVPKPLRRNSTVIAGRTSRKLEKD